ncbi:type I-U CRISPR-associated helicase/endonuclease Cas3 [Endozoicomonas sp. 8E]|uniref:type I-G CRISPR-associated helicase/endonuclease Cas3g n=1 Tax=Endozoicomonas sp. 8E TaxID=3035692 RepID=UPI002938DA86|nr:type I-U CRISPR-associated helicase/endonuclease Cas3 [Endozoicomonas sp. 8E]WOG26281.1 type I-U CRISPR-associated helicase/endonuclease Cas3 [Endozoicomonas sp. 8E]
MDIKERFTQFYQAVHGQEKSPFPWQIRLLQHWLENGLPASINLPTASGKTSTLDLAVFVLAEQALLPPERRTVGRRIFFVVDRRLVVDDAHTHAEQLVRVLIEQRSKPAVKSVADKLLKYGGESPLMTAVMRGGMFIDNRWVESPCQPVICLTTLDQVGSRLLFRGYGVSPWQWPIHAGLVANDSTFIIDEAHLIQPFVDTLEIIPKLRKQQKTIRVPFNFTVMSATLGTQAEFLLDDEDFSHPVLSERLTNNKVARLISADYEDFNRVAIQQAKLLAKKKRHKIIGVIVNRVDSARAIFEELNKTKDVVLLTGRIRPYDRDRLLEKIGGQLKAGDTLRKHREKPLYVIATQTVEVGADISFDALVTECASLEALQQRFGRLDRLGKLIDTEAMIILRKYPKGRLDPVYQQASGDTFKWLKKIASGKGASASVNMGNEALAGLKSDPANPPPTAPINHAPVLMPALVDLWVQTAPRPEPEPDIEPYLRGVQKPSRDVYLIWRADLPPSAGDDLKDVDVLLSWLPPTGRESLAVPAGAARSWLTGDTYQSFGDVDCEEVAQDSTQLHHSKSSVIKYEEGGCRWVTAEQIRPGDTLVIPSGRGGSDEFGWLPEGKKNKHVSVKDLAEQIQLERFKEQKKGQLSLRLQPNVLSQWLEISEELSTQLSQLCVAIKGECGAESLRDDVDAILEDLSQTVDPVIAESLPLKYFLNQPFQIHLHPSGDGVILTLGRELLVSDTWDKTSHTRPIALEDHLLGVEREIQRLAEKCGLPDRLAETVAQAGKYHDIGKADRRFQTLLHGGDSLAAAQGEVLAKSGTNPSDREALQKAHERSALPKGFRHEILSVAVLQRNQHIALVDRGLVEYLVGTHHGRCRPLPPVIQDDFDDSYPLDLFEESFLISSQHNLQNISSGWIDNFWFQVHRFDWWTLAYLEAIVRLGDWAHSWKEAEE